MRINLVKLINHPVSVLIFDLHKLKEKVFEKDHIFDTRVSKDASGSLSKTILFCVRRRRPKTIYAWLHDQR